MKRSLLLLVACGSPSRPPVEIAPAPAEIDAGPRAIPITSSAVTPQRCPPLGGRVPTCAPDDNPGSCKYPKYTCACGYLPLCGQGMPPSLTWVCGIEADFRPCPH